ncbi:hypothetical protein BD410DRAFT_782705 [Rickenella mellea]|uniref:Uncharacterized protein n=1 Tax=Rickenella mellea TaxID=50990 RepID=A0A4Y7QK35_9AGAM|nr:hypothetical protein BD410DRAFT_782705 [Rickenella mellea]
MSPAGYDLYFTASRGNPRQCMILGEDVEKLFFRFETPEVYMTNTRTSIHRNQELVAVFDWTATNYLGLATVIQRPPFPMSRLVLPGSTVNSRAFVFNATTFEWRRRQEDPFSYDLYGPQNVKIGIFRRIDQSTPVGPSHGFMHYTFVQPALLLESLLALCINRWIDMNGIAM